MRILIPSWATPPDLGERRMLEEYIEYYHRERSAKLTPPRVEPVLMRELHDSGPLRFARPSTFPPMSTIPSRTEGREITEAERDRGTCGSSARRHRRTNTGFFDNLQEGRKRRLSGVNWRGESGRLLRQRIGLPAPSRRSVYIPASIETDPERPSLHGSTASRTPCVRHTERRGPMSTTLLRDGAQEHQRKPLGRRSTHGRAVHEAHECDLRGWPSVASHRCSLRRYRTVRFRCSDEPRRTRLGDFRASSRYAGTELTQE